MMSEEAMIFVVLQFSYGTRAWVPLSCYEREFENIMEYVYIRRTVGVARF